MAAVSSTGRTAARIDRRSFLVLGGAFVLAACADQFGSSDDDEPDSSDRAYWSEHFPHVELIGDSIFAGSATALVTTLEGAGVVEAKIDAQPGRRMKVGSGENGEPFSGASAIYVSIADGAQPSAWVISLGTNDIGNYATAEEYAAQIDTILAMVPPPVPLVWVNVYVPYNPEHTNMFNTVIEERLSDRGDARVADWYSVASSPDRHVLADTVHPNEEGQQVLAMLVLDALGKLNP